MQSPNRKMYVSIMTDNKKIILDCFQNYLLTNYRQYCSKHGIGENLEAFVTYLIDQNLITSTTIKRYTVVKEFNKTFNYSQKNKTKMVAHLASKFHISERSVWNILRQDAQQETKV